MNKIYKLMPVSYQKVKIKNSFWGRYQRTNATLTIPAIYQQLKKSGRIDAWKLDWTPESGKPAPHIFWDSDVAKWIEAAAYSLKTHPNQELEKLVDETIDLIAQAQQPDGYLNIYFTSVEPEKRWTNLRDCHELYCAGHLTEAAVAYDQSTGKRKLLDVMCKYIDYIETVFGSEYGKKKGYPGHEEIELALVKLYHITKKKWYLNLAKYFIDERGKQPHYYDIEAHARGEDPDKWIYGPYQMVQAHVPVREQTEVVGHAVRAMYLLSGVIDVANETGDAELLQVCERLWGNLISKRIYVTGGIGSSKHNEGFTLDYDLPNDSAYSETCAAIGLVFWAHRMLQINGESRYADIMEKCLYNSVISGISLDGTKFFYVNPLASKGNHHRQEWFECACCPPNIARLLASLGNYIYSTSDDSIFVHLFVNGTAEIELKGQKVKFGADANYPWDEKIVFSVDSKHQGEFTIAVRIPGWCRAAKIAVNREAIKLEPIIQNGYAHIKRKWNQGDQIELTLPMPVEQIETRPEVTANAGRVALQRGPIVYCIEEADNGSFLNEIFLSEHSEFEIEWQAELLGGIAVIKGKAKRRSIDDWDEALYRPKSSKLKEVDFKAIPYFCWENRDAGEMLVWIRSDS